MGKNKEQNKAPTTCCCLSCCFCNSSRFKPASCARQWPKSQLFWPSWSRLLSELSPKLSNRESCRRFSALASQESSKLQAASNKKEYQSSSGAAAVAASRSSLWRHLSLLHIWFTLVRRVVVPRPAWSPPTASIDANVAYSRRLPAESKLRRGNE